MEAAVEHQGWRAAFFGRTRELRELQQMLEAGARLVTVVAPGGYGKSRLVHELCARMAPGYEHGSREILLAPVRSPLRIARVAAEGLGLRLLGDTPPLAQLLDYLRGKQMLLHFDNFEHLMPGAQVLNEILAWAEGIDIVASSREPLRLEAERVYSLAPLPTGLNGAAPSLALLASPAAELFSSRAAEAQPAFALAPDNAAQVDQVCDALDGVPLAIELAAAWMDTYSLPELLRELRQQLDIVSRDEDVATGHRSLRASCDWSFALLNDEQRLALRCLSVFKGGFDEHGASAMLPLPDMPAVLDSLVDKSWLYTRELAGRRRYLMHDAALREYAFQRLLASDDFEVVVLKHASYFADILEQNNSKLRSAAQLDAVRRIRLELENIYEALDTVLRRLNLPLLAVFARCLHPYLMLSGAAQECLAHYHEIKACCPDPGDSELEAHTILGLARSHVQLGSYREARACAEDALQVALRRADARMRGEAETVLGELDRLEGRHPEARMHFNRALGAVREAGDTGGQAAALQGLGWVEMVESDYATARTLIDESLALRRGLGDEVGVAACLSNLANMAYREGQYGEAAQLGTESLEACQRLGDQRGVAQALNSLGNVEFSRCDYTAAWNLYGESLRMCREAGSRFGIATSLNNLGNVEYCVGHMLDARKLHEEGLAIKREIGDRIGISYSLNNLGNISTRLMEYARAARELQEALEIALELSSTECMLAPLGISAHLLCRTGAWAAAGTLYSGVQSQSACTKIALDPMDSGMLLAAGEMLQRELGPQDTEQLRLRAGSLSCPELTALALPELAAVAQRGGGAEDATA